MFSTTCLDPFNPYSSSPQSRPSKRQIRLHESCFFYVKDEVIFIDPRCLEEIIIGFMQFQQLLESQPEPYHIASRNTLPLQICSYLW